MWFFLVKSILGAIVGQSTNAWFKKTKMGIWFYKKVDSWYNWAAKRYDLDVLTKDQMQLYNVAYTTVVYNNYTVWNEARKVCKKR